MAASGDSSSGDQKPTTVKKPYQRPELVRWGSMKEITLAVNNTGGPDGGGGKRSKTGRGGHYGDYWRRVSLKQQ